ncbi:AAA family ATPase [Enterococcus dongliensis]|uniref:AAA family ATPase n=1 Tax=Enterococcus dongliensis TaxID=2559925 RepID=A0AAW8TIZ7_9ENTE|nr:AAA family ATPase [Enterococcus dongliensis]MDT2596687.1 AAA family ATPase [Enterococcus dongliensis]MDT2634594.1 AAA family ATPase [Enterococcus dongliensis]MDT2637582.1 AAA family ATPase [Enterococcus dongliensis]MDT2642612.1 AAA family ATPase [Enterococcus dongliensis]MDT2647808.1 AAA family ATPase [Enterococcus dongliensis]
MWIKKAEVTSFGKWRQQTFLFEAKNQLVYGLNEAGKSTLYQFIQAMLFGFPTKRKKGQDYTPNDGSGFGGRLLIIHETYGTVTIERYKAKNKGKAKVWLEDGQQGDEELLEKILYPLNLPLFRQVFTFQQEQLQQLETLTEENLHEALISLGLSGSSELFEQRIQLKNKYESIYRPRGRKQPLNQALQNYQRLQQKINEKEQQEASFQQLVRQAEEEKLQVSQQAARKRKLQEQQLTLEQQRMNWSGYAEFLDLQKMALDLSSSEKERGELQTFYQDYQQLMKEQEKLHAVLQKHSGNQESARYYFYLENEQRIQQLLDEKVSITRMLDEEQRIAVKLAETNGQGRWQQHPPRPFADERAIQALFTPLQAQQKVLEEQQLRLHLVKEQRDQAETSLNLYEQKHPELFNNKKNPPWLLVAAIIGVIAAFFVPTPFRYLLLIAAIACGVGGMAKHNRPIDKDTWQEKLGQLDVYEGQLAEMTEKIKKNQLNMQQLFQQIQHELQQRNLSEAENEFAVIQENQQAQHYLAQQQANTELQQRQTMLHQKLLQHEQRFVFLTEWLPLHDKTLLEKLSTLEQFAKEMEQIRFAQTYQENTVLQQRIHEIQKQQQQLLDQYQPLLEKIGLGYPSEIPAFLQQETKILQKQTRLQELTERVAPLFPYETTLAEIEESLRNLTREIQTSETQLLQSQEHEQRSRLQIQQMQADGTLDSLYQQASQQRALIEKLTTDYAVAKLENQLLQDIATELSEQQLPELLKQATEYFQLLTNNAHSRLDFIDGLLMIDQLSLYNLSTGTKDQVMMAFRFAYLTLQQNHPLCPVIIDDGWLHYDHQRKQQFAKLLQRFSQNYQIICLSSDQEMVSYYQELHQPVWELKGVQ